jgi:hypothetical protein
MALHWLEKLLRPRAAARGREEPMPVVVGVARSGTTLLRLMLDAHPDLAIPAETHFLIPVSQLSGTGDDLRRAFFQTVTGFPTWEDLALPAQSFQEALAQIEPFTLTEGCRCFYRLYARRFQKRRWGDKSPPYCLHLDRIQGLLPEAHIVHLIRDGRDAAVSVKGLWFAPGQDMASLARHWRDSILTTRRLAQTCPHYLEIHYEELLHNTRAVLQRICRFIDLPFHSDMLRYHTRAQSRLQEVKTRYQADGSVVITREQRLALHRLTSRSPDLSRIGRWQQEMTEEDQERFEAIAGDLLRACGYRTRSGSSSPLPLWERGRG